MIDEAVKIGDQAYRRRIIDLQRIAKEAISAAEIAEKEGKIDLANKLKAKAKEFEELIANANIDVIDDEPEDSEQGSGKENSDEKNKKESDNDSENTENKIDNADTENSSDKEDPEETEKTDDVDKENSNEEESEESKEGNTPNNQEESDTSEDEQQNSSNKNLDDNTDSSNQDDQQKYSSKNLDNNKDSSSNQANNNQKDDKPEDSQDSNSQQKNQSQNKDQNQNNSNSKSKSNDEPVKDPFADNEDIPSIPSSGSGKPPRDATLDDIINQLKNLKGDAKKGALDGLKNLVTNFKESLTEAVKKGIRDYSDDEFAALINDALDLIDDAKKVNYVDNNEARKAKIQRWSTDINELQDLQQEDNVNIQQDYQKQVAREREREKYNKFKSLDSFKINFYNSIQTEVQQVLQNYQSYDEINPEYESEDIIVKADLQRLIPEEVLPVIDVYFDCSGSWGNSDIAIGKRAVATVKEFEDAGQIKLNIFYFADHVHTDMSAARHESSTGAWLEILQNIKATKATNVVVMTDHDMERDAARGPVCKVEGCVWWLWKNGENSQMCATHLIGKQSGPKGLQYMFSNYRR